MAQSNREEELEQLVLRINNIERLLGIQSPVKSSSEATSASESRPIETPVEQAKPKSKPTTSVGSRALGAVAIFCFIVAGVYFVKLAIETGWLTPFRQFSGLVLLGAALIFSSFQLRNRHGDYSGHLAGAGLAVLYLAVFSGQVVWRLFGIEFAVCCLTAISALGLFLFRIFSNGYFAAATCLGTYIVPLLLRSWTTWENSWLYYLLWDFAFTLFAVIWKDRGLVALASYAAIVGGMFLQLDSSLFVIFQLLQFVIFLVATGYYSIKTREPLKSSEVWALVPGILIFYGSEYSALTKLYPSSVNWFAIGFAAILFSAVQFFKISLSKKELESDGPIALVVSIILFHAGYLELAPESLKPWLGLLALTSVLLSGSNQSSGKRGSVYFLLAGSIILVETGKLIFNFQDHSSFLDRFVFPAAYGLLLLATVVQMKLREALKDYRIIPLFLGNSLMLLALSSFRDLGISGVSLSYLASACWAGYAVALLIISGRVGDSLIARSSLIVFGLVGLKILLVDSSTQGLGFRMVMLLIIGAFFYLGGALYGKVVEEKS